MFDFAGAGLTGPVILVGAVRTLNLGLGGLTLLDCILAARGADSLARCADKPLFRVRLAVPLALFFATTGSTNNARITVSESKAIWDFLGINIFSLLSILVPFNLN